tara:strand:+ start:231 stop:527 length:297 start_codon:yes stop_codon:yes gene_type:complete
MNNKQAVINNSNSNNNVATQYIDVLCKDKPLMVIQTKCGTGKYKFNRLGESEGKLYIEFKLIHDNDFKDCEKISHYLGEFCYLSPKQYLYAYKYFASA